MDKKVSAIKYSWWIGGILGFLISVIATSDSENFGMYVLIGIFSGCFWGLLIGVFIDSILESKFANAISNKIENIKEEKELSKITQKSIQEYNAAKHRFQYLSDETLGSKLKELRLIKGSEMQQLALEEEMVRRGLLSHSPMHEKLDIIKSYFKL